MEKIQIEIDEATKARIISTLEKRDLSLSSAFYIFINKLATDEEFSAILEPNEETAEVLRKLKDRQEVEPIHGSISSFINQAIK